MKTRHGHLFKRNGMYYVQWRIKGKLFMRSTRQGLFILSTQVALFRRDKQKSTALIVFPHIGVEVRHGTPFPGCVARAPLDE